MEFGHEGSAVLNHLRREFVAGGVAGSVGIFIGFPFDLIKVKLQAFPSHYKTAMDCLRQSVRQEGWLGLYNGCLPPIVLQGLINSLLFVGESFAMKALQPELKEGEVGTPTNTFLAGCAGGILQCVVLVPSDVIKCSMQANLQAAAGSSTGQSHNAFRETLACVRKQYRQEGVRGFYKGFTVTAAREAPSIGIYFFAYKFTRELLTKLQGLETPNATSIMLAGGVAGALSWTIVYPVDVIKTHIQISSNQQSASSVRVAAELYSKYGFKVFTRGLGTTIVRAFPVNASTFYVYELLKKKLHIE